MPDRRPSPDLGDRLDTAAQWVAVGVCVALVVAGAWSAVAVFVSLWGWV